MWIIDYWHWWIAACVLLILELIMPGVYFLWLSIAAVIVGLVVTLLPDLAYSLQFMLFGSLAMSSVLAWRHWLKSHPQETDQPLLNQRLQHYIGRQVTISEAIINGRGKAKLGDTLWQVCGEDCPVGTQRTVIEIEKQIILKVA